MRRTHTSLLLTVAATATIALSGAAAPAAAQEAAAAASAASQAPAGVAGDPNIDRGFLLPTAMTQPAGTLTYNNYELLLHGVTYAATDRVQLSLTALSPIIRDMPLFASASAKARLPVGERLHLALQGSLSYGHVFGSDDDDLVSVGSGLLASYCLRSDCSSLLSASVTYQLAFNGDEGPSGRAHLLVYGASLVHRVGNHVKLLGEITSAAVHAGGNDTFDNAPGLLASYGVRFYGSRLAADVGFMKPLSTEDDINDEFLLGLPFVNLSYRW